MSARERLVFFLLILTTVIVVYVSGLAGKAINDLDRKKAPGCADCQYCCYCQHTMEQEAQP